MAAFQDGAGHGNDHPLALLARQGRTFFNPVKRHLGGFPEDRKHRPFGQAINGVIAPLASGDKVAVNPKDAGQFGSGKRDRFRRAPSLRESARATLRFHALRRTH